MKTIQKFNSVSQDIIDFCIQEYNSAGEYNTETMKKSPPREAVNIFQSIIEKELGQNLIFCSGNYYKHTIPYLPHTDYKTYQKNTINVVIPLEYTGQLPHLIIFDQQWELDSVTWCMHHSVLKFETNIGVKGCPYEYPVTGLTNKPIDTYLYNNFLNHYPDHCLFGLSGLALPFDVGSLIIFNNKRIHCTGKMNGEKLGLSMRFKLE